MPGLANCHATPSTVRCAGTCSGGAGRSGPGVRTCTGSPRRLDPDSYRELATAVFAEMAATGITSVGEFHYLHHQPTARRTTSRTRWGSPSSRPRGRRAADLPARHLLPRLGYRPGQGAGGRAATVLRRQRGAWQERADELDRRGGRRRRRGRGDPLRAGGAARRHAHGRRLGGPVRDARCTCTCRSRSRRTRSASPPTAARRPRCWPRSGALTDHTSAVHATHLTDADIARLGAAPDLRLLLPDDRARPRRRHRPGARADRGRVAADARAATATRWSTCSRR